MTGQRLKHPWGNTTGEKMQKGGDSEAQYQKSRTYSPNAACPGIRAEVFKKHNQAYPQETYNVIRGGLDKLKQKSASFLDARKE